MSNRKNNILLQECVKYFKQDKAFKQIFLEMRKKWKKYGRIAGYIKIEKATEKERKAITSILGENFEDSHIKFSMQKFADALAETKYKSIQLQELLEAYFEEELISNKEQREIETQRKEKFFDELCFELENKFFVDCQSIRWIRAMQKEKKYGYTIFLSEYKKEKAELTKSILYVCDALQYLEKMKNKNIRLAVLAAQITSNPHYFDRENIGGKLLLQALSYSNKIFDLKTAEDNLALYYISGIKPDDISSFTILYGVSLYTELGIHRAYEEFIVNNEAYIVTLSNLNNIIRSDCKSKKVFLFENQMVFSQMCELLEGEKVSMICTSGQIRVASLLLIDLLCEAGCELYYSGDIDPEGVVIADKIIARHPNHIKPWRMTVKDYYLCISEEIIEGTSLKKLDKVKDKRFEDVVEAVYKEKKAGYQELLLNRMLGDIKNILNIE